MDAAEARAFDKVRQERDTLRAEVEQLKSLLADLNSTRGLLEASQEREGKMQQREQAWRNALQWLVLQLYQERCTRDAEGAGEITDCTETGACITEYCLPCYARKMMQALEGWRPWMSAMMIPLRVNSASFWIRPIDSRK
jgi:hypothetical protein